MATRYTHRHHATHLTRFMRASLDWEPKRIPFDQWPATTGPTIDLVDRRKPDPRSHSPITTSSSSPPELPTVRWSRTAAGGRSNSQVTTSACSCCQYDTLGYLPQVRRYSTVSSGFKRRVALLSRIWKSASPFFPLRYVGVAPGVTSTRQTVPPSNSSN